MATPGFESLAVRKPVNFIRGSYQGGKGSSPLSARTDKRGSAERKIRQVVGQVGDAPKTKKGVNENENFSSD